MISNFHTWQQCIITEGNNQLGPHRRSTKSIFSSTNIHKFYYFIVSCSKWDYYSVHLYSDLIKNRHFWIRTQRTQRTKWTTLSTENTCYIAHKHVHEEYQHASPWSIRKEPWSTLTTNLVHTEDYLDPQKINMAHVVMATMQKSSTVLMVEELNTVIMFLIAIMILINTLVITILIYPHNSELNLNLWWCFQ